jgi:hypothetical protein
VDTTKSDYGYNDNLGGCWKAWLRRFPTLPATIAAGQYNLQVKRTITWCPSSAWYCSCTSNGVTHPTGSVFTSSILVNVAPPAATPPSPPPPPPSAAPNEPQTRANGVSRAPTLQLLAPSDLPAWVSTAPGIRAAAGPTVGASFFSFNGSSTELFRSWVPLQFTTNNGLALFIKFRYNAIANWENLFYCTDGSKSFLFNRYQGGTSLMSEFIYDGLDRRTYSGKRIDLLSACLCVYARAKLFSALHILICATVEP